MPLSLEKTTQSSALFWTIGERAQKEQEQVINKKGQTAIGSAKTHFAVNKNIPHKEYSLQLYQKLPLFNIEVQESEDDQLIKDDEGDELIVDVMNDKLYVECRDGSLKYAVLSPYNIFITGIITSKELGHDIRKDMKKDELERFLTKILKITSEKGHTPKITNTRLDYKLQKIADKNLNYLLSTSQKKISEATHSFTLKGFIHRLELESVDRLKPRTRNKSK